MFGTSFPTQTVTGDGKQKKDSVRLYVSKVIHYHGVDGKRCDSSLGAFWKTTHGLSGAVLYSGLANNSS